jgi:hypothetical protein
VGHSWGFYLKQFDWTPGIGDPTVGGWITVGLYFVACASCWITARNLTGSKRETRIWWSITALFLALGINKQLDLQTALTEAGRVVANTQGWYQQRQIVQLGFILLVTIACLAATVTLLGWAMDSPAPTYLALVGVVLVIGFVLVRAASFHHIDQFIRTRILGLPWNWILEMGGISVVLAASVWRRGYR